MKHEWVRGEFEIAQAGQQILNFETGIWDRPTKTVKGIILADLFGIEKREPDADGARYYPNLTHLPTGWSVFACKSISSARIIAEYLADNYTPQLRQLRIDEHEQTIFGYQGLLNLFLADTKMKNLCEKHKAPLDPIARERFQEILGNYSTR